MSKFYRVKKDTFLWDEGAIIKSEGNGYTPIEDIWNKTKDQTEYITDKIVEYPSNTDSFERVYPDNLKGGIYRTADKLREVYKTAFKE